MPEIKGLVKRFGALPNDSNIYWRPFKQHANLGRSKIRTPLTHLSHSDKYFNFYVYSIIFINSIFCLELYITVISYF